MATKIARITHICFCSNAWQEIKRLKGHPLGPYAYENRRIYKSCFKRPSHSAISWGCNKWEREFDWRQQREYGCNQCRNFCYFLLFSIILLLFSTILLFCLISHEWRAAPKIRVLSDNFFHSPPPPPPDGMAQGSVKADFHSMQFSERSILCDRFLWKCVLSSRTNAIRYGWLNTVQKKAIAKFRALAKLHWMEIRFNGAFEKHSYSSYQLTCLIN